MADNPMLDRLDAFFLRWQCRLGIHDWEVGDRFMIYWPFHCRRCGKRKTVVS